jgi:hypothetical protein
MDCISQPANNFAVATTGRFAFAAPAILDTLTGKTRYEEQSFRRSSE